MYLFIYSDDSPKVSTTFTKLARCCWVLFEIQSTTNGQRNGRQDLIERELTPNQWIWQGSERFKKPPGLQNHTAALQPRSVAEALEDFQAEVQQSTPRSRLYWSTSWMSFWVFWFVWSSFGVQSPCWLAFFSRVYHLRIHQVSIKFTSNGRSFPAQALKSSNS